MYISLLVPFFSYFSIFLPLYFPCNLSNTPSLLISPHGRIYIGGANFVNALFGTQYNQLSQYPHTLEIGKPKGPTIYINVSLASHSPHLWTRLQPLYFHQNLCIIQITITTKPIVNQKKKKDYHKPYTYIMGYHALVYNENVLCAFSCNIPISQYQIISSSHTLKTRDCKLISQWETQHLHYQLAFCFINPPYAYHDLYIY